MLSIIIPSYKDPLLQKTIDSLLQNSEGEIQIIAVLDGYLPNPPLLFTEDHNQSVVQIHLERNVGMRGAINAGVKAAAGEVIMRTDEHCVFGAGFDRILLERLHDNWIVYPKRFSLDTEKWEVMLDAPNIYNKLVIDKTRHKFTGVNWKSREVQRKAEMIDDSMAMQGSCWVMKRSWWDKVIVELESEGYGTHYGDSHEMVFKTWQAGGRLMVNKNTWYAHKHRKFNRTHNYGEKQARPGWDYAIALWSDYYFNTIKPLWGI